MKNTLTVRGHRVAATVGIAIFLGAMGLVGGIETGSIEVPLVPSVGQAGPSVVLEVERSRTARTTE